MCVVVGHDVMCVCVVMGVSSGEGGGMNTESGGREHSLQGLKYITTSHVFLWTLNKKTLGSISSVFRVRPLQRCLCPGEPVSQLPESSHQL